jgi:hypothetical protein
MVAPTKAEAIAALTRSSSTDLIPLFIEHPKEDGPQNPSDGKHLVVTEVLGVEKVIKKDQTGTVRKVRGLARQKDNTLLAVLRWKGYNLGEWFELASNLWAETLLAEAVVAELGHHLRVTRRADLAGSQCRGAKDYEDRRAPDGM